MTHDDVLARLAAADPLPDEMLITEDDLSLLASLVVEARSVRPVPSARPIQVTPTPEESRPLHQGWTLRPALVMALAAAAMVVTVGVGVIVMAGRDAAPAGRPPVATTLVPNEPMAPGIVTTTPPTTTIPPTSTSSTTSSIEEVVAGLTWEIRPFVEALESGVLGFDRGAYDGSSTAAGLWLFERLQLPEPWPYDRFAEPDYECMGGWNGDQILESPDRIVAICDAGDWTPQRVRTFVLADEAWAEVPTEPVLWSGWINGDDNRDGSLGPAGIFGAATDIGVGFMANGTADFLWASEDGITWTQVPDTDDVFPERSITRAIGTSKGLVYIVGELDWPPIDGAGGGVLIDRLVVWIAELPDEGGME